MTQASSTGKFFTIARISRFTFALGRYSGVPGSWYPTCARSPLAIPQIRKAAAPSNNPARAGPGPTPKRAIR